MTSNPYAAPASMGDVSPDPFVPVPVTGPWTTWSVVRRTWRTFGRHWIVLSLGVGLISLPIMLRRFGIMWLFSSIGNTPLARVLVFLVPEALTAWLEAGMLLQWMTAFQGGRPRIGQIFVPAVKYADRNETRHLRQRSPGLAIAHPGVSRLTPSAR